jgi:hypothetical protein
MRVNLPKQLIPNRVGSSDVNMITSKDLFGWKPDLYGICRPNVRFVSR